MDAELYSALQALFGGRVWPESGDQASTAVPYAVYDMESDQGEFWCVGADVEAVVLLVSVYDQTRDEAKAKALAALEAVKGVRGFEDWANFSGARDEQTKLWQFQFTANFTRVG